MVEILAVLAIAGLIVLLMQQTRLEELEVRLRTVESKGPNGEQFDRVVERIGILEARMGGSHFPESVKTAAGAVNKEEVAPVHARPARVVVPPPLPVPPPVPLAPVAVEQQPPVPPAPRPKPVPQYSKPVAPPEPVLGVRLGDWLRNEEWETLVGGSLINKLGAIILVIGIALFLGYSFGHIGPAGRDLACIAVSVAMIAGGVLGEKRTGFRVFSRGVIGGGWAALYATVYAIYAIPEARIIQNPFVGSIGVLAIACGMIAHSLRYRAQTITAVAYSAAFAALAITPAVPFALLGLLPLAASALYLASRMNWYKMAVFVAAATYATCFSKSDPNGSLAGAQTILLAYWLIFEAFDFVRIRQDSSSEAACYIFPVNTIGFLAISYLAWSSHAPDRLWYASAFGAALYLGTAIVRALMRPPSSFAQTDDLLERLRKGSFEGPTLIAATLAAMAILGGSPPVWSSFAFALEAELLFLAGLLFRSDFLVKTGQGFFAVSLLRLAWTSAPDLSLGTPSALFHAFLFYANRGIRRAGVLFSTAAAALIAIVMAVELTYINAALGWTLFGIALLELGLFRKQREIRLQGSVLAAAGALWTIALTIYAQPQPWQPLAACLAILYVFALQIRFAWPGLEDENERLILQSCAAAGTAMASAVLIWRLVPVADVAIGWWILTLVLFELGLRQLPRELRWSLPFMAAAGTVAILGTHLEDLDRTFPGRAAPTYWVTALCGAAAVVRIRQCRRDLTELEALLGNAIAVLASGALIVGLWLVLPASLFGIALVAMAAILLEVETRVDFPFLKLLTLGYSLVALVHLLGLDIPERPLFALPSIAGLYWLRTRCGKLGYRPMQTILTWVAFFPLAYLPYSRFNEEAAPWLAAIAFALLTLGVFRRDTLYRIQSYILFCVALLFVLCFNIMPSNLELSVPVVVLLYAAHFVAGRSPAEPKAADVLSASGALLLTAVLYGQVSGGMLTVAWGTAGLSLLSCGFLLRDRTLRYEGLALLLTCTLKLFFYDLRNLETPYRILSFIVLGLILMSVSWIYTRFRDQVRRIL